MTRIYSTESVVPRLPVSRTRQLLVRQRLDLLPLELDVTTRNSSSLHDSSGTLVESASEQVGTDRLQDVSVDKASQDKVVVLVAL
jgi:hypothetical protein